MIPAFPLIDVTALSQQLSEPILTHLYYATSENFTGRIVPGYDANAYDFALLSPHAANALIAVQKALGSQSLNLLICDTYRPKLAVRAFKAWSLEPETDLERKSQYYPTFDKEALFELGYIAEDSQHCYGYAVDVVLLDQKTKKLVNMGCPFDFFGELSHHSATTPAISEEALRYRQILKTAMEQHGFIAYDKEYWHYSYHIKEIDTALELPISTALRGLGVHPS